MSTVFSPIHPSDSRELAKFGNPERREFKDDEKRVCTSLFFFPFYLCSSNWSSYLITIKNPCRYDSTKALPKQSFVQRGIFSSRFLSLILSLHQLWMHSLDSKAVNSSRFSWRNGLNTSTTWLWQAGKNPVSSCRMVYFVWSNRFQLCCKELSMRRKTSLKLNIQCIDTYLFPLYLTLNFLSFYLAKLLFFRFTMVVQFLHLLLLFHLIQINLFRYLLPRTSKTYTLLIIKFN